MGDDSDKITQVIKDANKQFDDKQANILFLIPDLRFPAFMRRDELIKAAFGESKITGSFNPQTETIGPVEVKFFAEGKFLNTKYSTNKQSGYLLPSYRRISIILCVEEKMVEKYPLPNPNILLNKKHIGEEWSYYDKALKMHFSRENEVWIDHDVLIVHNPHAYHPISQEVWREFPQFVPEGNTMVWTDGYDVSI